MAQANSQLKNDLDIRRATTRMIDLNKSRLLHTLVLCAANLLAARSYRVKHRLPDPWGHDHPDLPLSGDVPAGPAWTSPSERQTAPRPTRHRRSRRTDTWTTVLGTA